MSTFPLNNARCSTSANSKQLKQTKLMPFHLTNWYCVASLLGREYRYWEFQESNNLLSKNSFLKSDSKKINSIFFTTVDLMRYWESTSYEKIL